MEVKRQVWEAHLKLWEAEVAACAQKYISHDHESGAVTFPATNIFIGNRSGYKCVLHVLGLAPSL